MKKRERDRAQFGPSLLHSKAVEAYVNKHNTLDDLPKAVRLRLSLAQRSRWAAGKPTAEDIKYVEQWLRQNQRHGRNVGRNARRLGM